MSKKNIIIIAIGILILIGGGSGIFLYARSSSSPTIAPTPTSAQQQVLTLQPNDIGLALSPTTYSKGNSTAQAMHMEITKLDGVQSVDCEIHYTHTADTGGRIEEGILCNLDAKGKSTISQDFPFATCSDVCHPHKDIQDISVTIKVTKDDGKVYQVKQTMSL